MSAASRGICCGYNSPSSGLPNSPSSGSGALAASSLRPFCLPRSKPPLAPHTSTNDVQNSKLNDEGLDPEVDEIDSFEQHVDNRFAATEAQKHKRRKTIEFWDVKTIVKLSVKEDMKSPNGRKIVLRFNEILQPVEAEAGILSGVLGLLGSNYNKFLIYEKDRRKVRFKDKIYNKCVKEMFHFDEDSGGKIKRTILKMLGRAWKETRNRLYHSYYDSQLTLKQNIEGHLSKLLWIIGDGTLIIATMKRQRRSVGKMLRIDQSSYTLTLADRKGWQGSEKKSRNDKGGELETIIGIEQHDESSRLLSQNDSLAQALEKEHSGRVCGMGLGPTSSQVFSINSHQPSNGAQRKETQRVLLELQAELAAEKLKRKAAEDEVAAGKIKI